MRLRKKLQHICILTAWLFATGAQWDIAQTFAWAKMFSSYSESMSVGTAIKKTFSGKMCALCKAVDAAKQQQTATSLPSAGFGAKMIFVLQEKPVFIFATANILRWSLSDSMYGSFEHVGPPTPPPRGLV
ncbi:MAG: hypothetical protein WCO38_09040 [Verrucomicrobiota bacterium]